MIISQQRVPTLTFDFESDSLEAVSNNEIDAAALTPTVASYFNLTHTDKALRILDRDESTADLNWNVAVGMVRPDHALREAMDERNRLSAPSDLPRGRRRMSTSTPMIEAVAEAESESRLAEDRSPEPEPAA